MTSTTVKGPHRGPPHEVDGTEPARGKMPEFRRRGMAQRIEEPLPAKSTRKAAKPVNNVLDRRAKRRLE